MQNRPESSRQFPSVGMVSTETRTSTTNDSTLRTLAQGTVGALRHGCACCGVYGLVNPGLCYAGLGCALLS